MQYQGCLLAVRDIAAAKRFYEEVLHQHAIMDMGAHVAYAGFSLQQGYAELLGLNADQIKARSHSFQLYFEVEDLDRVYTEMKGLPELQWLHEIKEYPWGQRDIRLYDPDQHIVEIAEDMSTVVKRLLSQGLSVAEAAQRTMLPEKFVKQYDC